MNACCLRLLSRVRVDSIRLWSFNLKGSRRNDEINDAIKCRIPFTKLRCGGLHVRKNTICSVKYAGKFVMFYFIVVYNLLRVCLHLYVSYFAGAGYESVRWGFVRLPGAMYKTLENMGIIERLDQCNTLHASVQTGTDKTPGTAGNIYDIYVRYSQFVITFYLYK